MATGQSVYPEGTLVRTSESFTDSSGNPIDPSTVKLEWEVVPNGNGSPGSSTTWTYGGTGNIIKDSTGNYHADLDTTGSPGQWQGMWICPPGTGQATTEWLWFVTVQQVH